MITNVTKNALRNGIKPKVLFALLRNRNLEVRDIYVNYDPDRNKYFVSGPFQVLKNPLVKLFLD